MGDEVKIPWDMPTYEKTLYERVAAQVPEDRTVMEDLFKRYVDATLELIQTRDNLIDRANKAEAERDRLLKENKAALEWATDPSSGCSMQMINALTARMLAARAEGGGAQQAP